MQNSNSPTIPMGFDLVIHCQMCGAPVMILRSLSQAELEGANDEQRVLEAIQSLARVTNSDAQAADLVKMGLASIDDLAGLDDGMIDVLTKSALGRVKMKAWRDKAREMMTSGDKAGAVQGTSGE